MATYNLAFVIERYFGFGGLQRDMRRFAGACTAAGHEVTVFTSQWEGSEKEPFDIKIVDFHAPSNHRTVKHIESFVASLRKKNEFDCITGFNRVGGLDVYFGGDPCLKAKLQQNNRLWLRVLPRYRTYLQMEEAVFGPASTTDIMLISPVEREHIQRIYKTPSSRIHVLPPGIDRDRLTSQSLTGQARARFRSQFGIQDDGVMILTVGSGFKTKGIDRAICAIAHLPDAVRKRCHYVVVGQGKEKQFRAIARRNNISDRVTFTGGREDISNFYYAADLLFHPARTETAGHTILEAMVCALPVIATEHCGYSRYVRQADGGLLCPEPFDQQQINTMLYKILSNDRDRIRYGKNGQDFCQTADIYRMTEKAVEVIVDRARKNRGHN